MKALVILFVVINFAAASAYAQKKTPLPDPPENYIIDHVQPQPEFPGGEKAYYRFLKRNLKWPKHAKDTSGRVFVNFTIQKDGHITHVNIARGLAKGFDAEALRVVHLFPKWIPVKENGRPVKTSYTVPITFTKKR